MVSLKEMALPEAPAFSSCKNTLFLNLFILSSLSVAPPLLHDTDSQLYPPSSTHCYWLSFPLIVNWPTCLIPLTGWSTSCSLLFSWLSHTRYHPPLPPPLHTLCLIGLSPNFGCFVVLSYTFWLLSFGLCLQIQHFIHRFTMLLMHSNMFICVWNHVIWWVCADICCRHVSFIIMYKLSPPPHKNK